MEERQQSLCMRCGRGQHSREKCPARDILCNRCQRKGHYALQCLSKTIAVVYEEEYENHQLWIELSLEISQQDSIKVNRKEIEFKIDTGAAVTAISDQTYHDYGNTLSLTPSQGSCLAKLLLF